MKVAAALLLGVLALVPLEARAATTTSSVTPPSGGSCTYTYNSVLGADSMYQCLYRGDPSAGVPSRVYWLYLPPGLRTGSKVPLVVYLHGCEQTGPDAAIGTRFNQLASQENFIVVYPQQVDSSPSSAPLADGNGVSCWNWFLPEDQARGSGEPAAIAGITQAVIQTGYVASRKVFIDGISAGADMADIMAVDYPDVYAAGVALAGCAYETCTDTTGRIAYQTMGSRARVVPFLVEQGTADTLNPFPLGETLLQQWLGTDSLAGHDQLGPLPSKVDNEGFDQTPQPGSGNPCVYSTHYNFPCPGGVIGFQGTYPYTVEHFDNAKKCDTVDFWIIHGLEHAYPGGDPRGSYTDPLGPNMTVAAWDFFTGHPMGACR
jgi:poly(hydroxyalkanoate) depolymerase family esterase